MTFYFSGYRQQPFEISNSSEGLVRADVLYWMRTILFGYHKKDNAFRGRYRYVLNLIALILFGFIAISAQPPKKEIITEKWSSPLKVCWDKDLRLPVSPSIASDNEYLIIPLSTGSIISVLQNSGAVNWEADLGGNLNTRLFLKGSRLFAAASFGSGNLSDPAVLTRVSEINRDTGVPFWSREIVGERAFTNMFVDDDSIVLTSQDGRIQSLAFDGSPNWRVLLETEVINGFHVISENYFSVGTSNNSVVLIGVEDGRILSQVNVGVIASAVLTLSKAGRVLVGDNQGTLTAYDMNNSMRVWTTKTGAGVSEIGEFQGNAVVLSNDNYVYYISSENGKKLWKRKLAGRVFGYDQIDDKHAVFLTSGASTAVILDLTNGKLVNKIDVGDEFIGSPIKTAHGFAVPTRRSVALISNRDCN